MQYFGVYSHFSYAFLLFNSEDVAVKNYKSLQGKSIDDKPIFVDFCGDKSKNRKPNQVQVPGMH